MEKETILELKDDLLVDWILFSVWRSSRTIFEMSALMKMKVCVHSDVDIIFTYICLHILVLHTSIN